MTTTGQRLRELREQRGQSQDDIAKLLGIGRTTYLKYETGENKPTRKLKELSALYGVTADYIMGLSDHPHGTPFSGQVDGQFMTFANEVPPPANNIRVPIIASVKCGYNGLAYEYDQGYVYIDKAHGDVRAFRCYGDSMTGIGIYDGDIAIVRIQDDVECGQLAIVTVNNEEGCLKRVRKQEGAIILESANPDYPPRVFTGESMNHVHIVGRVLELRRTF